MISMNIRPPRAIAARKVERVPKVKARIRNSGRRNIGSATRLSIVTKATSESADGDQQREHPGLPQPVGVAAVGPDPVGDGDHRSGSGRARR